VAFRFVPASGTNSPASPAWSVWSPLTAWCALSVLSSSCKPRSPTPDELKATLVAHPEILFDVIKAHPAEFFQVVQRAGAEVQRSADAAARQDSLRREEDLANPQRPAMGLGRATIGPAAAPIVIVEYSDFQCPYCHRSVGVLRALIGHYGDRLRLVLKEAPLDMHPQAMPAARYFEAVLRQDPAKAWRMHDLLFDNQARLGKEGQRFIDEVVGQVGADLSRARKDAEGPEVTAVIAADLAEFQGFGFNGTPGFVVNGVRVDGSLPYDSMTAVIERTLGK
jgi:protein-disulfide isomerase